MIIGGCPYCDHAHMVPIAAQCPAYRPEVCEECGKKYWIRHSRIDPEAYTAEEFDAKFIVDYENYKVTERNPPAPRTKEEQAIIDLVMDKVFAEFEHELLYGTGKSGPMGIIDAGKLGGRPSYKTANKG
jgi:hypothetical protein